MIEKTKAFQYASGVISGQILACNFIIKACERFMRDLDRDDIYFDLDEAQSFTYFWENIAHVPELGKPSELPLPYAFIYQQVYGWKYTSTNLRRITDVLVEVGRKNIKTYSSAVVSLYELFLGDDPFPYVLHGANSRDQALYCTNMAGKIIRASPDLSILQSKGVRLFTNKEDYIKISYKDKERDGRIEAIPRDLGDGGNPSASVIDEYHEAANNRLVETIKSGQGARTQPVNIIISSPGHNQDGPLYSEIRNLAVKMLNGDIEDDNLLAAIYEQDNEDDWDNVDMIEKANPMLPYIPTIKPYVEKRLKEAKTKGGSTEVSVKIKNCGVWVDAAEVWIEKSIWIKNNDPTFDKDSLLGSPCWGGLDLSSTRDLTSFSLLFEVEYKDEMRYPLLVWNWAPSDYRNRVDYTKWVNDGYIKMIDGNYIDQSILFEDLKEIFNTYDVRKINYDKHMANWLAPMMSDVGMDITPIGMQGYMISQSIKEFERAILGGKVIHFNNPVLRWANSNCIPKRDSKDNLQLDKENEYNKIDPMVASALSFDAMLNDKADPIMDSGIEMWN